MSTHDHTGNMAAEIELLLKEPLGTVKARIRRGMMKLRTALERQVGA